jgi:hypothetical protein
MESTCETASHRSNGRSCEFEESVRKSHELLDTAGVPKGGCAYHRIPDLIAERDAAVARAERAEAERDRLTRTVWPAICLGPQESLAGWTAAHDALTEANCEHPGPGIEGIVDGIKTLRKRIEQLEEEGDTTAAELATLLDRDKVADALQGIIDSAYEVLRDAGVEDYLIDGIRRVVTDRDAALRAVKKCEASVESWRGIAEQRWQEAQKACDELSRRRPSQRSEATKQSFALLEAWERDFGRRLLGRPPLDNINDVWELTRDLLRESRP